MPKQIVPVPLWLFNLFFALELLGSDNWFNAIGAVGILICANLYWRVDA